MLIRLGLTALLASVGFWLGRNLDLADQWPYFEALRTTSSIIFGVMGALLAIVYPEIVKQGFRSTASSDPGSARNLRLVVDPLAHSALLLLAVVLLGPLYIWLEKTIPASSYIKGTTFSALLMMTFWQVWILILVLRPLDLLRSHAERTAITNDARRRIHQFDETEESKRR